MESLDANDIDVRRWSQLTVATLKHAIVKLELPHPAPGSSKADLIRTLVEFERKTIGALEDIGDDEDDDTDDDTAHQLLETSQEDSAEEVSHIQVNSDDEEYPCTPKPDPDGTEADSYQQDRQSGEDHIARDDVADLLFNPLEILPITDDIKEEKEADLSNAAGNTKSEGDELITDDFAWPQKRTKSAHFPLQQEAAEHEEMEEEDKCDVAATSQPSSNRSSSSSMNYREQMEGSIEYEREVVIHDDIRCPSRKQVAQALKRACSACRLVVQLDTVEMVSERGLLSAMSLSSASSIKFACGNRSGLAVLNFATQSCREAAEQILNQHQVNGIKLTNIQSADLPEEFRNSYVDPVVLSADYNSLLKHVILMADVPMECTLRDIYTFTFIDAVQMAFLPQSDNLWYCVVLFKDRETVEQHTRTGHVRVRDRDVKVFDYWKHVEDIKATQVAECEYYTKMSVEKTLDRESITMEMREALTRTMVTVRTRHQETTHTRRALGNTALEQLRETQLVENMLDRHTELLLDKGQTPPETDPYFMTTKYRKIGKYEKVVYNKEQEIGNYKRRLNTLDYLAMYEKYRTKVHPPKTSKRKYNRVLLAEMLKIRGLKEEVSTGGRLLGKEEGDHRTRGEPSAQKRARIGSSERTDKSATFVVPKCRVTSPMKSEHCFSQSGDGRTGRMPSRGTDMWGLPPGRGDTVHDQRIVHYSRDDMDAPLRPHSGRAQAASRPRVHAPPPRRALPRAHGPRFDGPPRSHGPRLGWPSGPRGPRFDRGRKSNFFAPYRPALENSHRPFDRALLCPVSLNDGSFKSDLRGSSKGASPLHEARWPIVDETRRLHLDEPPLDRPIRPLLDEPLDRPIRPLLDEPLDRPIRPLLDEPDFDVKQREGFASARPKTHPSFNTTNAHRRNPAFEHEQGPLYS